jgi:hypothetical protein
VFENVTVPSTRLPGAAVAGTVTVVATSDIVMTVSAVAVFGDVPGEGDSFAAEIVVSTGTMPGAGAG